MSENESHSVMGTPKRRSSDLQSPEMQPKDAKLQRKIATSPGLSEMIGLTTSLPTTIDISETIAELKEEVGATLDEPTERVAVFLLNKFNKHLLECIKSIEYIYGCNTNLEEKQDDAQTLSKCMKDTIENLKAENMQLKGKLNTQENNTRRNNLIIKGIPETRYQKLIEFVQEFVGDLTGRYNVNIEKVHRLGRQTFQNNRPRAILVRFASTTDRDNLWNARRELRGSKFYIEEDFPPEIQATRRKLLPVMAEARRRNHRCELLKDKIKIDGRLYGLDNLSSLPKEIKDGSRWSKSQVSFFGELCPASNFHPAKFTYDGKNFENSEKALFYIQAITFDDQENASRILKETDPRVIKNLSKSTRNVVRSEWNDSIKKLITPVLIEKFQQNEDLLEWLRSTGNKQLVEAAGPYDKIWGNGLPLQDRNVDDPQRWTGQNLQGKMLEDVRNVLCPEISIVEDSADTESEMQIPGTQPFQRNASHNSL